MRSEVALVTEKQSLVLKQRRRGRADDNDDGREGGLVAAAAQKNARVAGDGAALLDNERAWFGKRANWNVGNRKKLNRKHTNRNDIFRNCKNRK